MAKHQSDRRQGRRQQAGGGARLGKAGRAGTSGSGRGHEASSRPDGRQDKKPARRGPAAQRQHGAGRSDAGIIEGRRAVQEALDLGLPVKRALVQVQQGDYDRSLERISARIEEAGIAVERVPRARLDELSSHGAHQGVVLLAEPFRYAELADIISRAGTGDALVVVLDHVTDEGNFGAIVRSAEIVGAAGVVIANARAASVGTAAYKTSAGAVLHLPIARVPNLARALDELKEAGFWVGAASEHADEDLWSAPLEGRFCLVMGSEGSGISRLVGERCDFWCKIPQRGTIESLNVAQAATVMCYEWLRREQSGQGGAQ